MKLLDLFCGAGGASEGYRRAGFDVVGVDIEPQPRFPVMFGNMQFRQADARAYRLDGFDVIHASPPCQRYTRLRSVRKISQSTERYPDLIVAVRERLAASGVPYIIENVVGSPLRDSIMLCGRDFGLKVYRHRLFESNVGLAQPDHEPHRDNTPPAGHGVSDKGFVSITAGGIMNVPEGWTSHAYKCMAMGIDWMTGKELTEAIPPAYTEWIGRRIIAALLA